MNILIICSWFPPDTAISAVRPYMFAKYLSRAGHHVTVLRLGEFDRMPDKSGLYTTESFEVISVLGPDCPVEKFLKGDHDNTDPAEKIQKAPGSSLKRTLDKAIPRKSNIRYIYNSIHDLKKTGSYFKMQKKSLDAIRADGGKFDVVFSTYTNLENLYAGHYAAQLFGAKWIMDFRDPPIKRGRVFGIWNYFVKRALIRELKTADACVAVTEGFSSEIDQYNPNKDTVTINNGYEPLTKSPEGENSFSDILTICYTGGTLYDLQLKAIEEFAGGISCLIQNNRIDKSGIRIIYAGNDFDRFVQGFRKQGIDDIIDNRGYCDRKAIMEIQSGSDVFLDLIWNTKAYQGVVAGKFYEGIRAHKYILSVVAGDVPDSMMYLYNKKYGYGFCYETCRGIDHFNDMCDWLAAIYDRKRETKCILFTDNPVLEEAFSYETLTDKLMELIEKLCS